MDTTSNRDGTLVQLVKHISSNVNFLLFTFVLGLCMFLSLVCYFYALGQITDLELANYWCDKQELSQIYQHSIDNNLNEGTPYGCWRAKQFTINEESLFGKNSDNYQTYIKLTTENMIRFIIWITFSGIFVILSLIAILSRIVDFCKLYCNFRKATVDINDLDKEINIDDINFDLQLQRKNSKTKSASKSKSKSNSQRSRASARGSRRSICQNCCSQLMQSKVFLCLIFIPQWIGKIWVTYLRLYSKYFGIDSRKWVLWTIFKEFVEIFFQTNALIYYNGYDIFNYDKLLLASSPSIIGIFVVLLGLNSICVGILWMSYIFTCNCCKTKRELYKAKKSNNTINVNTTNINTTNLNTTNSSSNNIDDNKKNNYNNRNRSRNNRNKNRKNNQRRNSKSKSLSSHSLSFLQKMTLDHGCMPKCQCHGYFFRQIIFVIDSTFDSFYAIFPFIAVAYETNFQWKLAVGALRATNR